ncbi:MAG: hypothetical protein U0M20_10855, partial [Christensenellales bacterium]|nr:hypothetical protein [Christensenellales bacterium]
MEANKSKDSQVGRNSGGTKTRHAKILPEPTDNKLRMTLKDKLFCLVLTAVYAVIALLNLGSLQAPETEWKAVTGDSAVITFSGAAPAIGEIRVFGGLYEGE